MSDLNKKIVAFTMGSLSVGFVSAIGLFDSLRPNAILVFLVHVTIYLSAYYSVKVLSNVVRK